MLKNIPLLYKNVEKDLLSNTNKKSLIKKTIPRTKCIILQIFNFTRIDKKLRKFIICRIYKPGKFEVYNYAYRPRS